MESDILKYHIFAWVQDTSRLHERSKAKVKCHCFVRFRTFTNFEIYCASLAAFFEFWVWISEFGPQNKTPGRKFQGESDVQVKNSKFLASRGQKIHANVSRCVWLVCFVFFIVFFRRKASAVGSEVVFRVSDRRYGFSMPSSPAGQILRSLVWNETGLLTR